MTHGVSKGGQKVTIDRSGGDSLSSLLEVGPRPSEDEDESKGEQDINGGSATVSQATQRRREPCQSGSVRKTTCQAGTDLSQTRTVVWSSEASGSEFQCDVEWEDERRCLAVLTVPILERVGRDDRDGRPERSSEHAHRQTDEQDRVGELIREAIDPEREQVSVKTAEDSGPAAHVTEGGGGWTLT